MALSWLTARPIAHRGLHGPASGLTENTLPAIVAAAALGFAVEVDLQLTADGEVIVFHDDTLDRLTGASGSVRHRTLGELRRMRVGDERIPTLAELLEAVAGRTTLVLEVKSQDEPDEALERRVAALVSAYRGAVVVMSFSRRSHAILRRALPAIPVGLIAARSWEAPLGLARRRRTWFDDKGPTHSGFRVPDFFALSVEALAAVGAIDRRPDVPILAWTVRTAADLGKARRFADQIIFEGFMPQRA